MDKDFDALKEAINNFLWVQLPNETSLQKAEEIALEVFQRIKKEYDQRPGVMQS